MKQWALVVPQVAERASFSAPLFHIPIHSPYSRWSRSIRSLFQEPFFDFSKLFPPMPNFGRNFFNSVDPMLDLDTDAAPDQGRWFLPAVDEELTFDPV